MPPPPRFVFDHIVHHSSTTFKNVSTPLISGNVQVKRHSLVGLLCLFVLQHAAGNRDSEAFQNPGIIKVEFDLDGLPDPFYRAGMTRGNIWSSALQGAKWLLGGPAHSPSGFFENKYAIFMDLRGPVTTRSVAKGTEQSARVGTSSTAYTGVAVRGPAICTCTPYPRRLFNWEKTNSITRMESPGHSLIVGPTGCAAKAVLWWTHAAL